jgi:hypothetical protein
MQQRQSTPDAVKEGLVARKEIIGSNTGAAAAPPRKPPSMRLTPRGEAVT